MGKLLETNVPPRRYRNRVRLDCRTASNSPEHILTWCKENSRATVYWAAVKYSSDKYLSYNSRQKHFKNEYTMLTLWFLNSTDALAFIMVWDAVEDREKRVI